MEFLIYNIYVQLGRHNFQQIIGIIIGINCVPLPVDLTATKDKREANLISLSGILILYLQTGFYWCTTKTLVIKDFSAPISSLFSQIWHQLSTFHPTRWQNRRLQACHIKFSIPWYNYTAYGIYIFQIIRYAGTDSLYADFLVHRLLITKLN